MAIATWKLATAGTAVAGVALGSLIGFSTSDKPVQPIELMRDTERAMELDEQGQLRAHSPDDHTVSSPDPTDPAYTVTSVHSPDSPDSLGSPDGAAPAPAPQPAPAGIDSPDSPPSPDSPELAPASAPQPALAPAPAPDSPPSPDSPDSPSSPDSP
jgi:hypothetical protein